MPYISPMTGLFDMFDKVVIRLPFALANVPNARIVTSRKGVDSLIGSVDLNLYDARIAAESVYRDESGQVRAEGLRSPWDNLPSSFSSMAFRFFHAGNGFYPWPHVEIKASPAKIVQGHNVYGSQFLRSGVEEMLYLLAYSHPKIWEALDVKASTIHWLDCTFSAVSDSKIQTKTLFKFLSSICDREYGLDDNGSPTMYWSKDSTYQSLKMYVKTPEVLNDIKRAKAENHPHRVAALQAALDFSIGLIRLEASIKTRKLQNLGVPLNLFEFLKYEQWFFETHQETVCQWLWNVAFNPLLKDLEGQTMSIADDDLVKTKIFAALNTVDKHGKVSQRLSRGVWNTYLNLKTHGYDQLASDHSSTFFRHIGLLTKHCGFSKAYLKTLSTPAASNVVPIFKVINIDFARQVPDNWQEPVPRTLRLVG